MKVMFQQASRRVCPFCLVKDITRTLMCVLALYWMFDSLRQLLFR